MEPGRAVDAGHLIAEPDESVRHEAGSAAQIEHRLHTVAIPVAIYRQSPEIRRAEPETTTDGYGFRSVRKIGDRVPAFLRIVPTRRRGGRFQRTIPG